MRLRIGDEIAINGKGVPFRIVDADENGNPIAVNIKRNGANGKAMRKIFSNTKFRRLSSELVDIQSLVTPEWVREKMHETGTMLLHLTEFTGIFKQQLSNWINGRPMSHACKVMFYLYFKKDMTDFRLWDVENKTMLAQDQIKLPFQKVMKLAQEGKIILLQWTGKRNHKGQKIYDGDMLGGTFKEDGQDFICPETVFWDEENSRWAVDTSFFQDRQFSDSLADFLDQAVLGNIYEQSHLLPVKSETNLLK